MKHTIITLAMSAALSIALTGVVRGQETVQTTTTTNAGTISEFSPDTIVVKSETASAPIRYSYTKSTTYVDENGNPVSMETVKSGLPVTVYYAREGDNLIASKVVVRKTVVQPPPTNVEVSKSTTTTTTEK